MMFGCLSIINGEVFFGVWKICFVNDVIWFICFDLLFLFVIGWFLIVLEFWWKIMGLLVNVLVFLLFYLKVNLLIILMLNLLVSKDVELGNGIWLVIKKSEFFFVI